MKFWVTEGFSHPQLPPPDTLSIHSYKDIAAVKVDIMTTLVLDKRNI